MNWQHGAGALPPAVRPEGHKDLYERILERMHALGTQSLRTLWRLHERFPGDLPWEAVDYLEQARQDPPPGASVPTGDRRGAPRFPAQRATVLLAEDGSPNSQAGVLLDWSWGGMRILAQRAYD